MSGVYLNRVDARDIRNIEELLKDPKSRAEYLADPHSGAELFFFFRKLVVRLDKARNKTPAWKPIRYKGRMR